jgi:predicted nucleotidyltransferase component of viral defense system
MITDQEIDEKAAELQLRPIDVQKDYVYSWLLKGIFERPALAAQLVLKGGTRYGKVVYPTLAFLKTLISHLCGD